jgi:hypothetical protein
MRKHSPDHTTTEILTSVLDNKKIEFKSNLD